MISITRNLPWAPAAVIALILLLAGCNSSDDNQQKQNDQGSQPSSKKAQVMEMARRNINLEKSYSAKLGSEREVVVIARVSGMLEKRNFEPGDSVEKGKSLYTIEPVVYQTTVNQRKADVESAKAKQHRAQQDAKRFQRLLKQNSVSRQDYDQAMAELQVSKANVSQAQAALDSAQVNLDYTSVNAPVSGIISLSNVNVGNVVDAGTKLATITPMNPIEVRFQLPQQQAFDLRQQRSQQQGEITASLQFPDLQQSDETPPLEGKLDFLGSRVDQNTSTVQARAVFENPGGKFLPGQFVRVKLQGMQRFDVMAVPEIAVTQGLMGPQVFVLDEENKARTRTITLGELAGLRQIITEGLETGDRVIVSDPGGLKAGDPIDAQSYSGNPKELSDQGDEDASSGADSSSQPKATEQGDDA
ncbi:MAG: efflux RND transporter periplasmic adaptor subunit [Marinobacter sp.]|uniref:efflux RND transporter periplasmic adaptor subunit n=1 Tax=Marinobacter sp. TaxID=50741 RepID=UPI003F94CB61